MSIPELNAQRRNNRSHAELQAKPSDAPAKHNPHALNRRARKAFYLHLNHGTGMLRWIHHDRNHVKRAFPEYA